jgi:hypothetical protein
MSFQPKVPPLRTPHASRRWWRSSDHLTPADPPIDPGASGRHLGCLIFFVVNAILGYALARVAVIAATHLR